LTERIHPALVAITDDSQICKMELAVHFGPAEGAGLAGPHLPFCWTGGQGTDPYEQNTQQSPAFGLSCFPHPLQS